MTGSIEVGEATAEDFDEVHERLLVELNPDLPAERWRRLFDYPWRSPELPLGYVLRAEGRAVGFLALVFAPDPDPGGRSPVCNLSSWIVLDPFRGSALRLLAPVFARRDWTLVNLTPTPEVGPIFRGLGFRELETRRLLVLPDPCRILAPAGGVQLREIAAADNSDAGDRDAWIAALHRGLARFVRVESREGASLVGYRTGRLRGVPLVELVHVEAAAVVMPALGALQRWFAMKHGACMIATDARFLGGALPRWTRSRALPAPRLFRSPDRTAGEISHLFTEMVLLGL